MTDQDSHWIGTNGGQGTSLAAEPLQNLVLVRLQPLDVGDGRLQRLLHSQGGGAKADVTVLLDEVLQLPKRMMGKQFRTTD